jgi:hypothetical protein
MIDLAQSLEQWRQENCRNIPYISRKTGISPYRLNKLLNDDVRLTTDEIDKIKNLIEGREMKSEL